MAGPKLVNGSLGIVQGFETHAQVDLHAVQGAGVEQHGKGTVVAEDPRPPPPRQARYPVVLFSNGQQKLCEPVSFQVFNGKGEVEATRDQVRVLF